MRVFGMITSSGQNFSTRIALESFLTYTELQPSDLFYIIDNDCEFELPGHINFCQLRILRNKEPLSYAANMNRILREATKRSYDAVLLDNAVAFTPNWYESLASLQDCVVVPLTNREVQYKHRRFSLNEYFSFNHFREIAAFVPQILALHRETFHGYRPAVLASFAVARIPIAVLERVGLFDERFASHEGEDFDFCLRAREAGFPTQYALASYVLHLGKNPIWQASASTHEPSSYLSETFLKKWRNHLASHLAQVPNDISRRDFTLVDTIERENIVDKLEALCAIPPRYDATVGLDDASGEDGIL